MAAKKKKGKPDTDTKDLLDVTGKLKTAPCVPALREAVKAWRAGGYKGVTETTKRLLNHWFYTDHRLPNGARFRYHSAQQEAIETLIFVWEVDRIRTRKGLLERYALDLKDVPLPGIDAFARYCVKMATGSGKTKVMALAIAWQFLNAQREDKAEDYARTFLLVAPNVIVLERLRSDFEGGRIFQADPVVPKDMSIFWDFECVMRGDGEKAHAEGTLFITNIQQLYNREKDNDDEPDVMTALLGAKPKEKKLALSDFKERIALRDGRLMVLNDEAHHTHDETGEWNNVIAALHEKTPMCAQLDFSATPRFTRGALFPWIVSDYPLKQAILDRIVKRPMRGQADLKEVASQHASIRYQGYLTAGVERWKEYRQQLSPLGKKPILFIMLEDTDAADDVGAWLRTKYPELLGGDKTLVIHTNKKGEVTDKDLDTARKLAREVDSDTSQVGAIVSVLMLREGWDVQNVTVVVGLRPYTAKANILPEQAIGRGLRLMFRGGDTAFTERVDIIGNSKFLEFVDDLEKIEGIKVEDFDLKKDKVKILTIMPVMPDRAAFDITMPILSPALVRKKSLAQEIAELDVDKFVFPAIPMRRDEEAAKSFKYEGYDVITMEKELERQYKIPEPQTSQEVIGYYARRIAEQVKLPAQFAALAPKVREFFERRAFGKEVDLSKLEVIQAMATPMAHFVTVRVFSKALQKVATTETVPELLNQGRSLSTCRAFPWSQVVAEAKHTVFNLVPCGNEFEKSFALFLDKADDVDAFAKLPGAFGFCVEYLDENHNLRMYYPDFVARDTDRAMYLLETKGAETVEVKHKKAAADQWCENATALTGVKWTYRLVRQKAFEELGAKTLSDLAALEDQ